jgi:hypothetical protein
MINETFMIIFMINGSFKEVKTIKRQCKLTKTS